MENSKKHDASEEVRVRLRAFLMRCCGSEIFWLGEETLEYCPKCGAETTTRRYNRGFVVLMGSAIVMRKEKRKNGNKDEISSRTL